MVNKKMFDWFEEIESNNAVKSAKEIEKKVHADLVNYANGKVFNATRDSRVGEKNAQTLNNDFQSASNVNQTNSVDKTKEKQRVRTLGINAPKIINNQQPTSNIENQERYTNFQEVSREKNPFDAVRNGGSINANTILIVIASFVIVVMIIVICLTILGNFEIKI